jgi:copper chaperone CopZ
MRFLIAICVVVLTFLPFAVGCAATDSPGASAANERGEASFTGDSRPIEADEATLVVRGLSCPKCANNVNLQLDKVEGVAETHIDMGKGEVRVVFEPLVPTHPSKARLARAITDAGFTIVDIRTP